MLKSVKVSVRVNVSFFILVVRLPSEVYFLISRQGCWEMGQSDSPVTGCWIVSCCFGSLELVKQPEASYSVFMQTPDSRSTSQLTAGYLGS